MRQNKVFDKRRYVIVQRWKHRNRYVKFQKDLENTRLSISHFNDVLKSDSFSQKFSSYLEQVSTKQKSGRMEVDRQCVCILSSRFEREGSDQ